MPEPFKIGKPVYPPYFINRKKEIEELHRLLSAVKTKSSTNVALIGLRRTGKTSIIENLIKRFEKDKKIICIDMDCYGIPSKIRFSELFMKKILDEYARKTHDKAFSEKLKIYLKKSISSIFGSISELEISIQEYLKFSIKLKEANNEDEIIESALNYIEALAEDKNVFFIVALDEFQDLFEWDANFLKRLRTIIQKQKRVAYIFSGSITTIMNDLVYKKSSPFYHQLHPMFIKYLPENEVKKFFKRRLGLRKLKIENSAIDKVVELTNCLPEYVQRLGIEIVYKFSDKKMIRSGEIENAFENIIQELDGEFLNFFKRLPNQQKEILIAIVKGKKTASEIAKDLRKPVTSIPSQINRIINSGILEKADRCYKITDPLFQKWLEKRWLI